MQEKTIGEKIREYRQKLGLTQDALAAELHISSQAISKWENGQTMPDINLLVPISKVLRIGLNDLLGTDRRAEFERRWQQMIPFGEEMTLLVSEEALEEFPDDETFLYRRAVDCLTIAQNKRIRHYLNSASQFFSDLHHRYPDNDTYISFLAEVKYELGDRDNALKFAYKIKDSSVRNRWVAKILGGDELIRYEQKELEKRFSDLYGKLLERNTRETIDAAYAMIDAMMPKDKKYCWDLFCKDASILLDEGDIEGYLEKYRMAYESARAYDNAPDAPMKYPDPLFDKVTRLSYEEKRIPQFVSVVAGWENLAHPASLGIRREIVREQMAYRPLHRHDWKRYFQFCQRRICKGNFSNYGMGWHIPEEEGDALNNSLLNKKHGVACLTEIWLNQSERLIGGKIARGTVACCGETFYGFCHCGAKESFANLGISKEELAIPTAPDGSKILSIVELMIPGNFKRCGMEEKLLTRAFEDALKEGFTHAEVYPLERMLEFPDKGGFDELFEIYTRMGFKIVRDLSNERDGRYYIMQRELKHVSVDSLKDFEFHDSTWKFSAWENGNLTIKATELNIHKGAEQNHQRSDMEIKEATVTFSGIQKLTYTPPRTWKRDENGNSYTDEPLVVYENDEAKERFISELKAGIMVLTFEENNGVYELGGIGSEFVSVDFAFDSVRIEWDSYEQKAWYEGHRHYDKQLVLSTPSGDVTVKAMLREHDVPVYYNGVRVDPPSMTLNVAYDGKKYWSNAVCRTWEEAFAALQKGLPEGVRIRSCLTCRHGNFSPYGKSSAILCLKNYAPKNKLEVCDLLNSDNDHFRKLRDCCFICPDYREASKDFYAYNDYLNCLNKESGGTDSLGDGTFYEKI